MMARKVLMLGNSHTAASRIALLRPSRRLARIPARCPCHAGRHLELKDGVLYPQDAEVHRKMPYYNGITDLPVSGYDAFAVIGCLAFHRLADLQDSHRSLDFPSVARGERCRLVSSALVEALLAERIGNSPELRLIRALAAL